jgi:tetratricopeptide (TPR) repeat protein
MNNLNFLIADSTSARSTIRQLLAQWKVPSVQVATAESIELAKTALTERSPHVAILDSSMVVDWQLLDLFESSRLGETGPKVLVLLAQKGSGAFLDSRLDDRIDAVIAKPFTLQSLSEQLEAAIRAKTQPNPYEKTLEVGRAFRRAGKSEKASQIFALAEKLNPAPSLACWYQGDIARSTGEIDAALSHFKRGLTFQKDCVRNLEGALDCCFTLGHSAAGLMIAQFLIDRKDLPAKHIEYWAEAALKLKHHDRFLRMYEYAEEIGALDGDVAKALFDGLVELVRESGPVDLKAATLALRRAEVCTRGDNELIARLLASVIEAGMQDEARNMMGRVGPEVVTAPEVRVAELSALERSSGPMEVLQRALDMINNGVKTKNLFRLAIEKSRELNRRPELIEDLVLQAQKTFPDAPEFSKL